MRLLNKQILTVAMILTIGLVAGCQTSSQDQWGNSYVDDNYTKSAVVEEVPVTDPEPTALIVTQKTGFISESLPEDMNLKAVSVEEKAAIEALIESGDDEQETTQEEVNVETTVVEGVQDKEVLETQVSETTVLETTVSEKTEKKQTVKKDPNPVKDWVASEGATLRGLLTKWGNDAGWRVVWNMDRDYTLEASATFRGRFVDVSGALLRSFARARPAPKGTFYKGNKVLVVSTREDENAE